MRTQILSDSHQTGVALYLIESPLQLLSAIAAVKAFNHRYTKAIISYGSAARETNNKHIDEALIQSNFTDVIKIKPNKNKYLNILKIFLLLISLRIRHKKIDAVCIGDWRSEWMHRVIEVTSPSTSILLDDGIIVVDIVKNYLANGNHNRLKAFEAISLKHTALEIIYKLLGSTGKKKYEFTVFTAFFKGPYFSNIKVINNNYKYLKKYKVKKITNEVFYFGTKLSEAGYFSIEIELMYLQQALEDLSQTYPNMNIFYIPHRDDTLNKRREIENLGYSVKELGMPAELYFWNKDAYPYAISGAYSTAVANLRSIYRLKNVTLYKLPIHKINPEKKSHVIAIYEFYESQGFKIKSL